MIKHHPKFDMLQSFVKGELPASLSAGIAIHSEMCPVCQQKIVQLTEHIAERSFEQSLLDTPNTPAGTANLDETDFDKMIDAITDSTDIATYTAKVAKNIDFKNTRYTLPTVLNNMVLGKTANIGKLARSRLQLDEDEIHSSLLHIEPGGGVPEHTHKGFELTLLLEGSFHDDNGEYVKGDFIMLDASHKHQPTSTDGCLCYTVANDALHFTKGINKLLNSIGSFIY